MILVAPASNQVKMKMRGYSVNFVDGCPKAETNKFWMPASLSI